MKQYPSKLKYKKNHRISVSNLYLSEQKEFFPSFGKFALQAVESGRLTFKQIEACRKSVRRGVRKSGKIWLRVFTNISVTKKSLGIRMGKGKGGHSFWTCFVRTGKIICELMGVSDIIGFRVLKSAGNKLPIKTTVVKIFY